MQNDTVYELRAAVEEQVERKVVGEEDEDKNEAASPVSDVIVEEHAEVVLGLVCFVFRCQNVDMLL